MFTLKKELRQFVTLFLATLLILSGLSFSVSAEAGPGEQSISSENLISVSFRVEGSSGNIYPKSNVQIPVGSTVLDVMEEALNDAQVYYHVDYFGTLAYVSQIGNDAEGQFGVWDGWQYMVNGIKPWDAVNNYFVQQGDEIYFYYGNIGEMYLGRPEADDVNKLTLIPEVDVIPSNPVSGQAFQIKVTAKYDIYDEDFDLVASGVEAKIEGASVYFNGQYYVTDVNGVVTIPAAYVSPGAYEIRVTKDVTGSYPRLVRSEKEIVIAASSALQTVSIY